MKQLIYKSGAILATIHLSSIKTAHAIDSRSSLLQKSSMGLNMSLSAKDREQAGLYDALVSDGPQSDNGQDGQSESSLMATTSEQKASAPQNNQAT